MAKDCLQTKLKSIVNNNELPFLGYLTLFPDAAAATYSDFNKLITGSLNSPVKLINIGGHFTVNNQDVGDEYTIDAVNFPDVFFSEDTEKILIEKYAPSLLNTWARLHYDINELKYMQQITSISIMSGEMNFDIAKIAVLENLEHAEFNGNNLYYGDVSAFSHNTKLTGLSLLGNSCKNLTGDFNTWAANFPEKTVQLKITNSSDNKLTCNGVNLRTISTGNNFTLSFDGQGNVTCTA